MAVLVMMWLMLRLQKFDALIFFHFNFIIVISHWVEANSVTNFQDQGMEFIFWPLLKLMVSNWKTKIIENHQKNCKEEELDALFENNPCETYEKVYCH